jgi:hypothetical protein
MKIIEGAIYKYNDELVRLRKRVGIMAVLSRRKKAGFIGVTSKLEKVNKKQVAKFLGHT